MGLMLRILRTALESQETRGVRARHLLKWTALSGPAGIFRLQRSASRAMASGVYHAAEEHPRLFASAHRKSFLEQQPFETRWERMASKNVISN